MLEAAIPLPFLGADVREMSRTDCISTIKNIAGMSPDELSRRRGIERSLDAVYGPEPSDEERQEWARTVKASRIDQLIRAFELVSRLRSDEPEAWDEIEELYFDD